MWADAYQHLIALPSVANRGTEESGPLVIAFRTVGKMQMGRQLRSTAYDLSSRRMPQDLPCGQPYDLFLR